MKANRRRDSSEYSNFNNWYLEGCIFEDLTNEEVLALGMVYNMTGKAKNERTFLLGAHTNAMTKMAKQHADKHDVKKVTRNIWKAAIQLLIEKTWIDIVRTEEKTTQYGTSTIQHIQVTDYGLTRINQAINFRDNSNTNVNKLF